MPIISQPVIQVPAPYGYIAPDAPRFPNVNLTPIALLPPEVRPVDVEPVAGYYPDPVRGNIIVPDLAAAAAEEAMRAGLVYVPQTGAWLSPEVAASTIAAFR